MGVVHYRSRWIAPVSQPPIENGLITIEGGRIVEFGRPRTPLAQAIDLGDAIVIPGLINAHTHLELTTCASRAPYQGSFARWIKDLSAVSPARESIPARQAAIERGLRLSEQAGVSAIGDIGYGEHALAAWKGFAGRITGFLEVLGITSTRHHSHPQSLPQQVAACQAAMPSPAGRLRVGLSPHAPYSVARPVFVDTIQAAVRNGLPLCTHLAETTEEIQFLSDGRGPLRELLEEWNLWDGSFEPPGCTPVQYAHRLGLLDQASLLVHVNYVSDADLGLLADKPVHIVYCPRAHAFFQHPPHRFTEMLEAGINVCLGTDSLASNSSLSVLDELRHLRQIRPNESAHRLLHMATLAGAKALDLDQHLGSLAPGKQADFVAVDLEHPSTLTPLEDLLDSQAPLRTFIRNGRLCSAPE